MTARPPSLPASDWLRSPGFDLGLIGGVFVVALVLGGVSSRSPALFTAVLMVDVWLLAYPHVASTYTRIAFDRESARRHRFLLLGLPPLVLLATASLTWLGGVVALSSLYYYWQSWHYARQSHGIARAYQARGAGTPAGSRAPPDRLSDALVLVFPVWGVLHRVHQRPGEFYGIPLWTPQVPGALVVASGVVALALLSAWTLGHLQAARRGAPRSTGHALFVLSHVAITAISYLWIGDITRGWLYINIWHNAQYLLFVWAMNARRFAGGVDPRRPFLSRICQREQLLAYALTCVGLSTAFYLLLGLTPETLAGSSLAWMPCLLVCHMAVNFHHYLVDAVIWRSPRRS